MKCIDQEMLDMAANFMDNDIREQVHFELAPCSPELFLRRYIELDPDFEKFVKTEFNLILR